MILKNVVLHEKQQQMELVEKETGQGNRKFVIEMLSNFS